MASLMSLARPPDCQADDRRSLSLDWRLARKDLAAGRLITKDANQTRAEDGVVL